MGETDFLVTNPSFINGIGRSIDLFGQFTEYNKSKSGKEADAKSLYNDWKAIGKDIKNTFVEK